MAWSAFTIGFGFGLSLVFLCRWMWSRLVKLHDIRALFTELQSDKIY